MYFFLLMHYNLKLKLAVNHKKFMYIPKVLAKYTKIIFIFKTNNLLNYNICY